MNAEVKSPTCRSATARILRWVRYLCLTAIACLIGYVSRDWPRSPSWRKEVPLFTFIAGVSEARNEVVLVSQFDQDNKPIFGMSISKRKKDDPPNPRSHEYELVPVAELVFEDPSTKQPVFPRTITIETCELSSGKVTSSLTVKTDNIYSSAALNERAVTLAHHSGGILQVDRANGATVTRKSFLGSCLLSPTGEYWSNHKNLFSGHRSDTIYKFVAKPRGGYSIGGFKWSPDGRKVGYVVGTFIPVKDGHFKCEKELMVYDVISKTSASIPLLEMDEADAVVSTCTWIDDQHLYVDLEHLSGRAKPKREYRVIGGYRVSGTELVKVPSPWYEVDPQLQRVSQQRFPDGTWFARSNPVLNDWEQRLIKLVARSNIDWLMEFVEAYQRNRSTRFERRKEPRDKQLLASVVASNINEFQLSEENRYLITSTVICPSDKGLDRATALARTKQFVAVYNFTPAVLPTWLFQLSVAAIAFVVLFAVSTLFSWLVSIVSRRFFRSKAPQ